jgi:hypothetical protein
MAISLDQQPINVFGTILPSGAGYVPVPLAVNGTSVGNAYVVPEGQKLVLQQALIAALVASTVRIQRSADGITWRDVAVIVMGTFSTSGNAILVFLKGGERMRVLARNEDDLGDISVNLQGYLARID